MGRQEVDALSRTSSPSVNRPYGVVRVCQEWGLSRTTFSHQQGRAMQPPREPAKRGPKTRDTDEALLNHIRQGLAASPFLGEGPRKVWARLRVQGIRTSKLRVLRLMCQAGLLAPSRAQRTLGPRAHDGTIVTARPNQMWGTDAPSTVTLEDGLVTVFVGVDHCTLEGVGIHAAKTATRFEALEPLRQGVRRQFGPVTAGIAAGLQVRHDHGSPYMSDAFQAELRFPGITSSPAFVRAPEGNGVAERFIRTLKDQVLWVKTFRPVAELGDALQAWLVTDNEPWLVERPGFRSPAQVRRDLLAVQEAA